MVGILGTNLTVSLYMTTIQGLPGISEHVHGPIAVWSPTIVTVLAIEIAVIVLSLGLTFFVQSRKKDFV